MVFRLEGGHLQPGRAAESVLANAGGRKTSVFALRLHPSRIPGDLPSYREESKRVDVLHIRHGARQQFVSSAVHLSYGDIVWSMRVVISAAVAVALAPADAAYAKSDVYIADDSGRVVRSIKTDLPVFISPYHHLTLLVCRPIIASSPEASTRSAGPFDGSWSTGFA